jgi:hypothetical protein
MLRDGHAGLVLVLDEVETLQRVRGDVREKALNAVRQLLDELPLYPSLYLIITGTPAFFGGPQGVRRLTRPYQDQSTAKKLIPCSRPRITKTLRRAPSNLPALA